MAERTYFSRHISMADMDPVHVNAVLSDIERFNRIVHKATAMQEVKDTSDRQRTGQPDRRKKENKCLITTQSAHCFLKEAYGADDYFVNSAVNTAKASLKSVKELNALNISECRAQLKDLKKKRTSVKSTLTRLLNIKKVLIQASRDVKAGRTPAYPIKNVCELYDSRTGGFEILSRKGTAIRTYDNAYLFEVLYVDPKIRSCRNTLDRLAERDALIRQRIRRMQDKAPSICYGSKKFFRCQNDKKRYPDHDVWLAAFRKRRSKSLMISGRHDASQGNFRFRYDVDTHTLIYQSQSGIMAAFPDVEFPYGQDRVDRAINADRQFRKAVSWRITVTGGSFLIQCLVDIEPEHRINDYYGDGCIAMDTNYDNLSISELDGCGNVLRHKVISFDLEGASSGGATQTLSEALDSAFSWCDESKKPFAMEDLKLKHVNSRYGSKRFNFVTGRFAFSKITQLAESKALKHCVDIIKVNPAYTSQQGKLLYVKKYGMSIHEGASATIGRRAMGIDTHLPDCIRRDLPPDKRSLSVLQQWKAAYKAAKKLRASDMYGFSFK